MAEREFATEYAARVDPATCIGAKMCVAMAPRTFTFNPTTATSIVRAERIGAEALDAAAACPVEAIIVQDARTGDSVFP